MPINERGEYVRDRTRPIPPAPAPPPPAPPTPRRGGSVGRLIVLAVLAITGWGAWSAWQRQPTDAGAASTSDDRRPVQDTDTPVPAAPPSVRPPPPISRDLIAESETSADGSALARAAAGDIVITNAHLPSAQRYQFSVTAGGTTTGPDTTLSVPHPAGGQIVVSAPGVFLDMALAVLPGQRIELPAPVPVRVGVNRGDCTVVINGMRVEAGLPVTLDIVPGMHRFGFSCDGLGQWEETFTIDGNTQQVQMAIGRVPRPSEFGRRPSG